MVSNLRFNASDISVANLRIDVVQCRTQTFRRCGLTLGSGSRRKAWISPVEDRLHLQDSDPFVENFIIRLEPKTIARRALFSATRLRRFRHVALGNINLLHETALSSEVCKVKVFTARISGEQSSMTVAKYEDENGAKVEIGLGIVFLDKMIPIHPNVWQLLAFQIPPAYAPWFIVMAEAAPEAEILNCFQFALVSGNTNTQAATRRREVSPGFGDHRQTNSNKAPGGLAGTPTHKQQQVAGRVGGWLYEMHRAYPTVEEQEYRQQLHQRPRYGIVSVYPGFGEHQHTNSNKLPGSQAVG
ncbi:hypothetical protein C8J57DRAFT_1250227 [Mycena rebaudengoi]|nr:hypothetical protein C8J57DRAFT_1250227 [Mycena rebaudengoi]